MSDKTEIEWTDATWNPVTGCAKVSAGCKHCYAQRGWGRMSANPKTVYYGREFTDVQCHPERLDQPLRWQKPRMIFVNSMSDLFHESVPDAFIDQVFAVMALAPQHTFQVLTKRPERMRDYIAGAEISIRDEIKYEPQAETMTWPLENVWLGVSVENQESANERIPLLLQTPAAVRWISAEPLLGQVDLARAGLEIDLSGPLEAPPKVNIDWVVAGGESGPSARPMHPDWARVLRDQCKAAGVPFLFKQWGEWAPHQAHAGGDEGGDLRRGHVRYLQGDGREPDGHFRKGDAAVARVGKKAAGRLLDGRTWDGYPPLPNPLPLAGEGQT